MAAATDVLITLCSSDHFSLANGRASRIVLNSQAGGEVKAGG